MLVLAGTLALIAGLLWQMPLSIPLGMALAATHGRLSASSFAGPWHDGAVNLVCRSASGHGYDCGHYRISVVPRWDGPVLTAQAASGMAIWRGAQRWQGEARTLKLPAGAIAIVLPFVEQMQLGGELRIDGRISGSGRSLESVDMDLRWRGHLYEFPFAEQTLRVTGDARKISLHWQPTAARPRFEGGIECTPEGNCRGSVFVYSDAEGSDLTRFLAAGGRRDASDPTRFEFGINVR
jgi:hypothetical protein